MKAVEVTIKAIFEIPDDWEVVHNGEAIQTNDKVNIFAVDFLEEQKDGHFSSGDDEFFNNWLDKMETEECKIVEIKDA